MYEVKYHQFIVSKCTYFLLQRLHQLNVYSRSQCCSQALSFVTTLDKACSVRRFALLSTSSIGIGTSALTLLMVCFFRTITSNWINFVFIWINFNLSFRYSRVQGVRHKCEMWPPSEHQANQTSILLSFGNCWRYVRSRRNHSCRRVSTNQFVCISLVILVRFPLFQSAIIE